METDLRRWMRLVDCAPISLVDETALLEKASLPMAARKFARDLKSRWRQLDDEDDAERETLEAESEFFGSLQFDNDQRVLMYRKMIVDPSFVEQLLRGNVRKLGHHWATDQAGAKDYSYEGPRNGTVREIILCATVAFEEVNWDASVDRVSVGEEEIIPFAECPLKLKAIWVNGKPIPLPPSLPMMQA